MTACPICGNDPCDPGVISDLPWIQSMHEEMHFALVRRWFEMEGASAISYTCPKCGSAELFETTIGWFSKEPQANPNKAWCDECGWHGMARDLQQKVDERRDVLPERGEDVLDAEPEALGGGDDGVVGGAAGE